MRRGGSGGGYVFSAIVFCVIIACVLQASILCRGVADGCKLQLSIGVAVWSMCCSYCDCRCCGCALRAGVVAAWRGLLVSKGYRETALSRNLVDNPGEYSKWTLWRRAGKEGGCRELDCGAILSQIL